MSEQKWKNRSLQFESAYMEEIRKNARLRESLAILEAKLEATELEAKVNKYALSQEANGILCRCRYGIDMMDQVPEGSFCPFCGYRRYESVITVLAKLKTMKQTVDEQAEDEGLWFVAATAPEAYLQQELRQLHAVIEAAAQEEKE